VSHYPAVQSVERLSIEENEDSQMFVDSFSGPNFVTDVHDGGALHLTQKSVGIMVGLHSGMDISTLKHSITIVPKKYAKITVEVKEHPNMLDPFLRAPVEYAGCDEVIACFRVFLQERQRKGRHIFKTEAIINGDFEEGLVQPTMQAPGGPCRYKAMPAQLSPFRISNVGGTNANHSQGVVLTTFLLCKLHRDTINALRAPEYAMPVMQARSPHFTSPSARGPPDARFHSDSGGDLRYSGGPPPRHFQADPPDSDAGYYYSADRGRQHSDTRPKPTPGVPTYASDAARTSAGPQTPRARTPAGNLKDDRRYSRGPGAAGVVNFDHNLQVTTVVEDMDTTEEEVEENRITAKRLRQSIPRTT
jgi:hypothetical protein